MKKILAKFLAIKNLPEICFCVSIVAALLMGFVFNSVLVATWICVGVVVASSAVAVSSALYQAYKKDTEYKSYIKEEPVVEDYESNKAKQETNKVAVANYETKKTNELNNTLEK